MTATTHAQQASHLGQSIWYDNIQRSALEDGRFQQLIDAGVLGCTSNPSIFHKAIAKSADYDVELKSLAKAGRSAEEIYFRLVTEDIAKAADVFLPVYQQTQYVDGYVSVEVSPKVSHNTEGTVREGVELHTAIARPNVMIKVPATPAGVDAVAELTGRGLCVNATLIFSQQQYRAIAEAYLRGLEVAKAAGKDLSKIASVASFFISRIDQRTEALVAGTPVAHLAGKVAIANAKQAYSMFNQLFSTSSFASLAKQGAQKQRLLWASTGTKNPSYSDTLYLDELIGRDTVNTVPPATLDAFQDHGKPADRLGAGTAEAATQLQELENAGISLEAACAALLAEGLDQFGEAADALMASIEERRASFAGAVSQSAQM